MRVLHPGAVPAVLVIAVSAIGLVWCFAFDRQSTPLAYAIHALSAYALAVAIAACVGPMQWFADRLSNNRIVAALAGNEGLRASCRPRNATCTTCIRHVVVASCLRLWRSP